MKPLALACLAGLSGLALAIPAGAHAQSTRPTPAAPAAPLPTPSTSAEPAPAAKQDQAELDRTPIIGNRELPKVLYIVPWKKPVPGQLNGRPPVSVLDEALAPVDRDVFRRELRYDAQAAAVFRAPSPSPAPK